MPRKRLSMIALTVAAVAATTLTTAQPAQAERSENCERVTLHLEYAVNMYDWHYVFYGPDHAQTDYWAGLVSLLSEALDGMC